MTVIRSTVCFLIALVLIPALVALSSKTFEVRKGNVDAQTSGHLTFKGGGSAVAIPELSKCEFKNLNCNFTSGSVSYALPDGSSAMLKDFVGALHALGDNVYRLEGRASGKDNAGHEVEVRDLRYTFTRSANGTNKYMGGLMVLMVH